MSENIAIKLQGVKKQYRLGQIGGGTLQGDLQSWWARKRGKEDPNTKIGTDQRLIGQTFMALNGIDLEIPKGQAIGIIGKNGAGKSTMLKLLCRVTAPTEGTIDIYGRIASMLEVGTGFHPEMTGRENVYMNGAILGMTKAEIDAKMDQIIEFSEVGDFIDTPVKRYSSGMYVKLAFSVAAHLDSEIMIMDEVLAVGDMKFQQKCLSKMRDAATTQGKTVLYVSHNMNTIRQLCDRCVVLSEGRIIFDGDVEEAIGVYLNSNNEADEMNPILSKMPRPNNSTNRIRMDRFTYLNTADNVFRRSDTICFELKWRNLEEIDDVKFRMIIRYQDDTAVGLVQSENIVYDQNKKEHKTVFQFKPTNLAEGKYYASIAFFQTDGIGGSVILDHITRAVSFEILEDKNERQMLNWEHRWWGSVRFDDLVQIMKEEELHG